MEYSIRGRAEIAEVVCCNNNGSTKCKLSNVELSLSRLEQFLYLLLDNVFWTATKERTYLGRIVCFEAHLSKTIIYKNLDRAMMQYESVMKHF